MPKTWNYDFGMMGNGKWGVQLLSYLRWNEVPKSADEISKWKIAKTKCQKNDK